MKTRYAILVGALALLVSSSPALAQTFPGSDDFADGDTAKWDDDVIRFSSATADGNLSFANGRLEYIKAATAAGTATNQYLRWNSGNGTDPDPFSYTTSWVMTVDATNLVVGGYLTSIGIQASNYNNDGYASLYLAQMNSVSSTDVYVRGTGTGMAGVNSATFADNTAITLRLAWDAPNQIMSSSYAIDGSTFTSVNTYPISSWSTAPHGRLSARHLGPVQYRSRNHLRPALRRQLCRLRRPRALDLRGHRRCVDAGFRGVTAA